MSLAKNRLLLVSSVILIIATGCGATLAVRAKDHAATAPRAPQGCLTQQGAAVDYWTICTAHVTRGSSYGSARVTPYDTLNLHVSYCGSSGIGSELGQDITADNLGFHTWSWQAPASASSCDQAVLTYVLFSATGRFHAVCNYDLNVPPPF